MALVKEEQEVIGFSKAKAELSQLTEGINRNGIPVLVLKNNKPWVIISPAAESAPKKSGKKTNVFGVLKGYAQPGLREQEKQAWEESVGEAHAAG